jgi:hypothetical protein
VVGVIACGGLYFLGPITPKVWHFGSVQLLMLSVLFSSCFTQLGITGEIFESDVSSFDGDGGDRITYPAHGYVSKRDCSITLWKNVSATYVGIVQRILQTYPNFVRRVISHFVRAHHGKFGGLVKRQERPPRLSCPFNAVLFGG